MGKRDWSDLYTIVSKVEPRLRAVFDAMEAKPGKDGRPAEIHRDQLLEELQGIYERHTGSKATTSIDIYDRSKGSPFLQFVNSVNAEMPNPLPEHGLETVVYNFLNQGNSAT